MTGDKLPTMQAVAREAGVSLATVSNVMNQPSRVTPATRDKVRAAQSDTEVAAVCAEAGEAVFDNKRVALLYARSLAATNASDEAQAVLKRTIEYHPGDIDARGTLAHLAGQAGDFALALKLYGALSEEAEADLTRYEMRMRRFLDRAAAIGILPSGGHLLEVVSGADQLSGGCEHDHPHRFVVARRLEFGL